MKVHIILLLLGGYAHLAEPGCLCTEQAQWACKQSSWSRVRNSQENRLFVTASGVGTRFPTWTIAVLLEKTLNLHPSKCQVPNHSWWGWWRQRRWSGAWTQDLRPWAKDTPLHHIHTHTHMHTHTCTHAHTHTYTRTHESDLFVLSINWTDYCVVRGSQEWLIITSRACRT